MLYRLTAKVEGHLLTEASHCFRVGDLLFEVTADAKGMVTHVAVAKHVDPEVGRSRMIPLTNSDVKAEVHLPGDRAVVADLVRALQHFESHVAFMTQGSLTRVLWQNPEHAAIPESEEERALVQVFSHTLGREYPVSRGFVRADVLAGMAARSFELSELTVHKAFLREADSEFHAFRYIQAFVDYYLVLEGLYANGRSSEDEIVRELTRSRASEVFGAVLTMFQQRHAQTHWASLNARREAARCPDTVEGWMRFVVRTRNGLVHFHPRSSKLQATPFTQDAFESVALFAAILAVTGLGYREAEIAEAAMKGVSSPAGTSRP